MKERPILFSSPMVQALIADELRFLSMGGLSVSGAETEKA